jgi:hypothetical protein
MRVTNDIPLGSSLLLPVCTVNCVQTLKAISGEPTDKSPGAKKEAAARKKISFEEDGAWKKGGSFQNSIMWGTVLSHPPP